MRIRRKTTKREHRWLLGAFCLIWATTPLALSAQDMRPLSLKESLEAAVKHERVVAAQSIAQAAQAEIRIADRAPAPTLSGSLASIDLEHGVGTGPLFTGKPLDKGLALDWTWERGEKRSYRTNVSKAQALALVAESQEVIKQQQLIVIDLFYEALSAQERLGILNELAKRAEQLATIAAQRFGLGDLSAQDLARLEIEAERARVDLIHSQWLLDRAKQQLRLAIGTDFVESMVESARGAINLNGKDETNSWKVSSDWPKTFALTSVDVEQIANEQPAVRAAWARLQSAMAQTELAKAQDFSDPSYGVGINHYPGTSKAILALRASIPLYGKNYFEGEKQRAHALLQVAETQHAEVQRRTRVELHLLLQNRVNAHARLAQFELEMLPKALKVARQAEEAFAQGGQTLTDLLEARRTLKSIQLEALQWRTEFAKAERAWSIGIDRSSP